MKILIKNELRQSGRMLMVWLALMLILCGFCYFEFLSLRNSLDDMVQLIGQFPPILKIMFGVQAELTSALGWYGCIYFWTGILAYAYAAVLGLSCVAKEKRQGTSEYLFTKPVSRTQIILSKAAAAVLNLLIFSVFSGIFNYVFIILPLGGLEQTCAELTTTLGLFLTQLLIFLVALLTESLSKSYRTAVRLVAALVLGFYAVYVAAEYTGIGVLRYLTPLQYFNVYDVAQSGFQIQFLVLTVLLAAVCIRTAVVRWNRREL